MQYKGLKKKWAKFIVSVVETVIDEKITLVKDEVYGCITNMQRESQSNNERVEVIESNLRNNNTALEQIAENCKNNNTAIEQIGENCRNIEGLLNQLKENCRNNNTAIEQIGENCKKNNNNMELVEENCRNIGEALKLVEENCRNNNTKLEGLVQIYDRIENIENNIRNNNVFLEQIKNDRNFAALEAKIEVIKNSLKRIKNMVADGEHSVLKNNISQENAVLPAGDNAYGDIDYFSFENHFRGSEQLIRERQKMYLPYFKDCKHVIDLGCGRGEFLELLKENGITAKGVDFYDEFVCYAKNKGLDVVEGDAIATLASINDKVDGIFAGQLVEHLSVGQIIALCQNAYDKLEEGSYFIMETPNPTSLAIYTHAFYMDPSHQKPVHPLTLKYLTEKAGFSDVQIVFTEASRLEESIPKLEGEGISNLEEFNKSMQKVAEYLYGSQDYAIIARR